jgi:sirohydrochlorin cobaltochelatase
MASNIILFAHGARDDRWRLPLDQLAQQVRGILPGSRVEVAFMEFQKPSLADTVDLLCTSPATAPIDLLVVPVFLAAGGHVARDVPILLEEVRRRHPQVRVRVSGALGEEREVVAGMVAAIGRLATTLDP